MTPRSPDEAALLASVWGAPHDDLPRLVYADWLEEHGATDADRGRAEFIRLQCDRAAKEAAGDETSAAAYRREEELARRFGEGWAEDDGLPWGDPPPNLFVRGLVAARDTVTAGGPDRRSPPGPPWVGEVEVEWGAGGLAGVDLAAACAGAYKVRLYARDTPWTAADFASLDAAAPALRHVTHLELSGRAGPEAIAWARQVAFDRVHCLELDTRTRPGADLVAALAESPLAPQLTKLDLQGVHLTNAGLWAVGQRTEFARLRALYVGMGTTTERGYVRFLRSPLMSQLEEFDTPNRSECGDAYYLALAAAPGAARLRYLGFGDRHRPTHAALRAVAASPHLQGLREVFVPPGVAPSAADVRLCRRLFGDRLRPRGYWGDPNLEWDDWDGWYD